MDEKSSPSPIRQDEAGQSIVLIVFMIIGLLAFAGLAVDVGFLLSRYTNFSTSLDDAVTAGVIELDPTTLSLDAPDERTRQFLAARGWPTDTLRFFTSTTRLTQQGLPMYSVTATVGVETYFMGFVGFNEVEVQQSATALYAVQSELYTPSAYERGQVRKAAQFILGPDSCSREGDPISPKFGGSSSTPNINPLSPLSNIRYRIRVPTSTYTITNQIQIELFDPDSGNAYGQSGTGQFSNSWSSVAGNNTFSWTCASTEGQSCVIRTDEGYEPVNQNPFWLVRVDENYDSNCNPEATPDNDVITQYTLYYLDADGDRQQLSQVSYGADPNTDMKWVSPNSDWQVTLDPIPVVNGARYIYLDVETTAGTGKNVWDVRAGYPYSHYGSPGLNNGENVNTRNLRFANNPGIRTFPDGGIDVFAIGQMPLQFFNAGGNQQVEMALAPLPPSLNTTNTGAIYATLFDYEGQTPINFTIDTLSTSVFNVSVQTVNTPPEPNPLAMPRQATCGGDTDCNNEWMFPQVRMAIPNVFYGGNLMVTYTPYNSGVPDAHTWSLQVTGGKPVLVE